MVIGWGQMGINGDINVVMVVVVVMWDPGGNCYAMVMIWVRMGI